MSVLAFDTRFMEEIAAKYSDCVSLSQDINIKLDKARTDMQASYKGQGEDMVQECFAKIKEHMQLLEECFSQTGQYVTYTKETIDETEEAMVSEFHTII